MAVHSLPFKQYESVSKHLSVHHCLFIIAISLVLRVIWIEYNGLLVEEAYYWNYAQHLDFSYFDHPPMVAVLIKIFTVIFGLQEASVHLPAIFCWMLTAVFIFKLTDLISKGAGWYAVMLFSVLPYFFIQSVVTTPDMPVMICWAAALYYLYRSLVLNIASSWYAVGVCLGLGMVSKYTIVLLGLPILSYLLAVPSARGWFARKEPYIALLIAVLLFTPVIYWNATHEWASFIFQSVRRFKSKPSFSLHAFIGLLILFVTPLGIRELGKLVSKKQAETALLEIKTIRFLQFFTFFPLSFFGFYSLNHAVKFDWIGPGLLPVLTWFAILINNANLSKESKLPRNWFVSAGVLLAVYIGVISITTMGLSGWLHQKLLAQYFSWGDLTRSFNEIASQVEKETNQEPLFAPLDSYHINSELSFYQTLFANQKKVIKPYSIVGVHVFSGNSLMYKYWSTGRNLAGKTLILISDHLTDFEYDNIKAVTIDKSPIREVWSHSQRGQQKLSPFYYKIVEIKPEVDLIS